MAIIVTKEVWNPLVGEKLPIDIKEDSVLTIQGQLQFERVAFLSAMYRELVH